MEQQPETAAIYVRVSTEEQALGFSLQTQVERCRAFADQQGLMVVGEPFSDHHTGEVLERPALNALYDFVATQRIKVVIVYDTDRLSRGGPMHHGVIEAMLERHGARVQYVLGDYNTDSPESKLSKLIKQSIGWYENQQRRERSVRGRIGKAKAGRVVGTGRPPYGYRYADDAFVIVEAEAAIVRRIFAHVAAGGSLHGITAQLTSERVPTKGDMLGWKVKKNGAGVWGVAAVASIVHNETYTGTWHYRKNTVVKGDDKLERKVQRDRSEWLPVAVPAIIDAETFAQAQAACERNRWLSPRNTQNEYLVRGLVRCACGYACCIRNDRSRVRASYKCSGDSNPGAPPCPNRPDVLTGRLDAAVWQALIDLLLDENTLRQAIRQQRMRAQMDQRPLTERLDALSVTRTDVERKLAILVDQLLDSDFPKSIIDERKQLLLGTLRTIEAEERRLRIELASASLPPAAEESLVELAARIRRDAAALSFEERRQVVLMLQVEVTLLSKTQAKVACLLPMAQRVVELEQAPQNKVGKAGSGPADGQDAPDGQGAGVAASGDACTFVSSVSIIPSPPCRHAR